MIRIVNRSLLAVTVFAAIVGCQGEAPTIPRRQTPAPLAARTTAASLLGWLQDYIDKPHRRQNASSNAPALLAGAGDIARCYPGSDVTQFHRPTGDNPAAQTARLTRDLIARARGKRA